jgi:hypothetical protein
MDSCKDIPRCKVDTCRKGLTELDRLMIKSGECMSCHLIENTPKPISERPRVEARQHVWDNTKQRPKQFVRGRV